MKFNHFKKGNQSICTYLHQAKMMADELVATRNPIPAAKFNTTIFSSLGNKYGEIV